MAGHDTNPDLVALRKLEACVHADLQAHQSHSSDIERDLLGLSWRLRQGPLYWQMRLGALWPPLRRIAIGLGVLAIVATAGMLALWWRLASGPIELDLATPWLAAAIEENFGKGHHVQVGGTQLERGADGRTALRLRDVVVRDADGTIVASAPKAEVGVSGTSLISGRVRAERLSLVGAEMAVRIEPDGKLVVFAGANKRPIATASVSEPATYTTASVPPSDFARSVTSPAIALERPLPVPVSDEPRNGLPNFAALLAWIDGLSASGLDGRDLSEIGFKSGNLVVDDQRNQKQWTFPNVNLSVMRGKGGGVTLTVSSDNDDRPWMLRASITPTSHRHRLVDIEAQHVSAKDILLALRWGEGQYEPDLPISGRIRAEIGPDGRPRSVDGRILIDRGLITDAQDPTIRIPIDRAEIGVEWDSARSALVMPFQVVSGGNRFTLFAHLEAPHGASGELVLRLTGGTVVLAPSTGAAEKALVLNRFLLRLRVDPDKQRIEVEQGEIGNMDVRLAISGNLDYSTADPRLAIGIAGTRMPVAALKRLWPTMVSPKVRDWFETNLVSGSVERLVIATNAPLSTLKHIGPPTPDDGLSMEIVGRDVEVRPVPGLPAIKDADLTAHITGRTATVKLGRGRVDLSAGRRLTMSDGTFQVSDTYQQAPPARVRFKLDGPVAAAAELLALERLRDISGAPLDPATSRGTIAANVALSLPIRPDLPPGSTEYAITLDVANFSAERLVLNQKVEAQSLRVIASTSGYQIKGDAKISGVPAYLDYRKARGDGDAEVRLQATLDAAARAKLGFDLSGYLSGPLPIKLAGKIPANGSEGRYAVEADLTQARIDNLLPGWIKLPGRATRANFALISKQDSTRFEDLVIEGSGSSVKGLVEVDSHGDVVVANFPVFSLSDGDKTSLKAERNGDGVLRVVMRGEVYDGRGFVKSIVAGPTADKSKEHNTDLDLDLKLGIVAGFHGETLRGVELRMARRNGAIRSFALNARLGRDAPLQGDLRGLSGRQVIYLATSDAGALFRFSDTYAKIHGGEMWVAMDPPSGEQRPQAGILSIQNFAIRGEAALDRVVAGAAGPPGTVGRGADFSALRVDFTRTPGRFNIREGILRGPAIGATVDGAIDYTRNAVQMRGTFVPLYGLNNMFGQIPLFGIFLGGGANEGLVGVTYEVVGPPSAPTLRVNPISAVAPGLLRKFFEFPNLNAPAQSYADPARN